MTALEKATDRRGYVLCLDGVRAASILLVVMAHTFPIGPSSWELNGMAGRMGMALFFCLSGFLITTVLYRDTRIVPFLCKRIMRIVPAAFLCLIFLFISFDFSLKSVLLNMAFISNNFTEGLVARKISHFWPLAVEIHSILRLVWMSQ